jgi:hypothetical protein
VELRLAISSEDVLKVVLLVRPHHVVSRIGLTAAAHPLSSPGISLAALIMLANIEGLSFLLQFLEPLRMPRLPHSLGFQQSQHRHPEMGRSNSVELI